MKHRNLILLAVFLVLVGLFFFFRNREPKEKLQRVIAADSTQVARFHVFNLADTVVVARQDKQWMLEYPEQARVNSDMLRYFFDFVLNATYAPTPMSDSAENLARYGLDEAKALQLRVLNSSGKVLAHIHFGNTDNPYDYFRFDGDNKVYQVKQAIYGRLQPKLDSWRSPSILSIQWNEMDGITVKHTKNSYVLTRQASDWFYMDNREQFKIPAYNVTMGKILNVLASLEAYTFKRPYEVDKSQLSEVADVKISMVDKSSHHLMFYLLDKEYLMTVDDDESRYYVMLFDQVQRFTRHAEVFRYKDLEGE